MSEIDFAAGGLPGQAFHELLDALRERGPVVPVRFGGEPAWLITRHAELAQAFRDSERFPAGEAYRRTTEPVVGRSFISMDGEEHHLFRRLATPAFRSRAVERQEERELEALAHELVDGFAGEPEVDLVARFCVRLPLLAICRMLGIPRSAEGDFQRWAQGLLAFPFDPDHALACAQEFTAFLTPLVRERRREPREDVISELAAAEVEGRRLGDEEILSHLRLLFPTGAETTHGALGNLLYALLAHPGAWQRVVADLGLRHFAIEELLRWENPVAITPRVSAAHPVSFAGVELPPGSWVLFCMAAAHHDPRVFADPHRFDLDRRPANLLAFGPGPRSCPGMHLARKELAVGLDVLCERLREPRLLDPEAARPTGTVLRAPAALRVALG